MSQAEHDPDHDDPREQFLPGAVVAQGRWSGLDKDDRLIYLGGDRLLVWAPLTGRYAIWAFDRAASAGLPFSRKTSDGRQLPSGTWYTVRSGHELIVVASDRVIDWKPKEGSYRLWRYDSNPGAPDPLPGALGRPLVTGIWSSIRTGHCLLHLDGEFVLDWEPASGHYHVWCYDHGVTSGDPFPDGMLAASGNWPHIKLRAELIYLGGQRLLHWENLSGHATIWSFDSSFPDKAMKLTPVTEHTWGRRQREHHQMISLDGNRVLDVFAAPQNNGMQFKLWQYDPTVAGCDTSYLSSTAIFAEKSPPGAWKLDRQQVAQRLRQLAEDPEDFQQDSFGFCGFAAFLRHWTYRQPRHFIEFSGELFDKGSAMLGTHRIAPKQELLDQHYDELDVDQLPFMADWMVMSALQESTNIVLDFDGTTSDEDAIGQYSWTIASLFRDCGAYTSVSNQTDGWSRLPLSHALGLQPSAYTDVILLVNASFLPGGPPPSTDWGPFGWFTNHKSNHFICLNAPIVEQPGNKLYVQYWSWGMSHVDNSAVFDKQTFLDNYHGAIIADSSIPRINMPAFGPTLAPVALSASYSEPRKVTLSWDSASASDREYTIVRKTASLNFTTKCLAMVPAGTTTFVDLDLGPSASNFDYSIQALSGRFGSPLFASTHVNIPAGDVIQLEPRTTGQWTSIGEGKHLVYVGNSCVLEWDDAGNYRLWKYDPACYSGSDPLLWLLTHGKWINIDGTHRLIYLGGSSVLDWVPETGECIIWRFDPAVRTGDPLPAGGMLAHHRWSGIRTGRELVYLYDDRVLDWEPSSGKFRVWRYDRSATGDPFPGGPIMQGQWSTVGPGHRLLYAGNKTVLDLHAPTGRYRLWKYDHTVTHGDPLPSPALFEATWRTYDNSQGRFVNVSDRHEVLYVGDGQILSWAPDRSKPETGVYAVWQHLPNTP